MSDAIHLSGPQDLATIDRPSRIAIDDDRRPALEPATDGLIPRIRSLLNGRWHWAVLLALLFGGGAGVGGWFAGQKIYVSHGEIYVAPYVDDYGLGDPADRASLMQNYESLMDTQVQYVRSMRVLDKAITSDGWRSLNRGYSSKSVADFNKNLLVTHKGELIFVEMRDKDAAAATLGSKSVVEAYQSLMAEEDAERGHGKLEFLRSELARTRSDLLNIDATIRSKMKEQRYGDYSPDDLTTLFASKLTEAANVNGRLNEVRREIAVESSLPTTRQDAAPTLRPATALVDPRPTASDIAVQNAQMAALLSRQRELQDHRQVLQAKYGPNHESVKQCDIDLARTTDEISDFRDSFAAWQLRQQAGLNDPLAHEKLVRLEASLIASVSDAKDAVDKVTRLKLDIQELRDRAASTRTNSEDVSKRLEAQERVTRIPGRVRVLESGDKPLEADSDTRPRLAAAGGIFGSVFGIGVIALFGLLDQRVRSPDDARRIGVLGRRPVLGLLPELPDNVDDPAQAARCVHQVRTLLQLWYGDMTRPVFAVAGPASGSGKTTLTLALGLSYAAARSRTLLIDFDLIGGGLTQRANAIRRRRIGGILMNEGLVNDEQLQQGLRTAGESNIRIGEALTQLGHLSEDHLTAALTQQQEHTLGVVDVLEGEPLADCVFQTEVANLSILPLGDAGAHHVGSISPLGIQQLVEAARAEYDIVLIDTGPLPGSLEGAAAVAAADGVVLTVSRGDSMTALRQCERYLESISARLAGVVFNRATPRDFLRAGGTAMSSSLPLGTSRNGNAIPSELGGRRFGPFGEAVTHASKKEKNAGAR